MRQDSPLNHENPYSADTTEVDDERSERSTISPQGRLLIILYLIVAAYGGLQVVAYSNMTLYLLYAISVIVVLTAWAITDSRSRNRRLLPIVKLLYVVFCPLSTGIYLIATRGWRGLAWAIFNAGCLYSVLLAAFYAVYYALYFSRAWQFMDPVFFELDA